MIKRLRALSTFINRKVNISLSSRQLCVGCLSPTREGGLCAGCVADLRRNEAACTRCALPLAPSALNRPQALCGPCISNPPSFDHVNAPWLYAYPIDGLIGRFKYGRQRAFGKPLADLLARDIAHRNLAMPDCLVPVPMHPTRERERGFNQAQEVALWLADRLQVPVANQLVRRRAPGRTQSGLTRKQRLANLKGAFQVSGPVPEHIVLVDDVVTTGATAQEIAGKLKKAGARRVEVWALARTPRIPLDDP